MATAELAAALPALVALVLVAIGVLGAAVGALGCEDAAQLAARSVSQGDSPAASLALARGDAPIGGGREAVSPRPRDGAGRRARDAAPAGAGGPAAAGVDGLGIGDGADRARVVTEPPVYRRPGRDHGSATIWLLGLSGLVALVAAAGLLAAAAAAARQRADAAADLGALAGAAATARGGDSCAAAAAVVRANGAELQSCVVGPGSFIDLTTAVPVPAALHRLGFPAARAWARRGAPQPSAQARSARTASSSRTPPALSSGALPLPHFGDCTHDGQPLGHSHASTAVRVAASHCVARR